MISRLLGDRFDFELVWKNQDISPQLKLQSETWLREVGDALFASADGKMISEWAKRPECWEVIKARHYSAPRANRFLKRKAFEAPNSKRSLESEGQSRLISCLALPNNKLPPSRVPKCVGNLKVAFDISGKLLAPEIEIALWRIGQRAILVPVPEAPVDVDRRSILWKYYVGLSRYVSTVQAKPISQAVQ